jgi:Transposase and inactivated derivatives
MKRYEITNEEWERIEPLLPPRVGKKGGRPRKDDRTMLTAIIWLARTGCQWREIPERYGKWEAVYARFRKWQDSGLLERIFRALSGDADMENLSIDSTCAKVHESANGNKKGR